METKDYVKIEFRFYSDILDEWTVETMWAATVDGDKGLYKLDNIPFYAPVASDDIVLAEYDEAEQRLVYSETVEYSGNSTVQVVIMDTSKDINEIRAVFEGFGCISERLNDRYFVIEVPADKDYLPVKQKLTELREGGIIDYAEPRLSGRHQY